MGRMKEFGMELAYHIYVNKKTDEQLLELYPHLFSKWLLRQIEVIRHNPKLYDPTYGRKKRPGRKVYDETV